MVRMPRAEPEQHGPVVETSNPRPIDKRPPRPTTGGPGDRGFLADARRLQAAPAERRYLASVLELYVKWMEQASDLSTATVRAYKYDLNEFVASAEKDSVDAIGDVDQTVVEAWRIGLMRLERATIRRKMAAVSAFFQWAVDHQLADSNPVRSV